MKKREYTIIEKTAVYLAKRSLGKSVPIFSYKVKKPVNIEECFEKVKK